MIPAVTVLCLVAGALAIPIQTDYYPKGHIFGGLGINNGVIGINDHGFESRILGINGGNSAAAASAAASGLNSAAAAAASASDASGHFGQQGIVGLNNGFNNGYNGLNGGLIGGNSAAASAAAAAASGMNAASASAAANSAQMSFFLGNDGHIGHQMIGGYNGPFVHQVPSVQFPAIQQQFNGLNAGSAAASAAAAGQNAAAVAAAASGANFGSQIGLGGIQYGAQFVQPASYYPGVPVVGQNIGASSAASATASNNAAAAAAAATSRINGVINSGIIGRPSGIVGPQYVRGKKY